MLSTISNLCFQSVNIFPYIKVFKKKSWYVQLAIAEELYFYKFPFYFPKAFLNYQNRYQLQAQLSFLLAFSVREIEKVFDVEEFLVSIYNIQVINFFMKRNKRKLKLLNFFNKRNNKNRKRSSGRKR